MRVGSVIACGLLASSLAAAEPLDVAPQLQTLARVAACSADGPLPARFDAEVVAEHCRELGKLERGYQRRWMARAKRFLARVVPDKLPPDVVYPFGGGDLATALLVFPKADEITTLSLEPAGDVRAIEAIAPGDLAATLADVRAKVGHLFAVAHSKTLDMRKLARAKLPGEVIYELVGLHVNNCQATGARYFRPSESGELRYLTEDDLAAATDDGARARLFADLELRYRCGEHEATFRHIAANLDDQHLRADPSILRHLEAKGEVAAITKAASYLLWWNEFSLIRKYLLDHMVWMISDSTGVPVEDARRAGFEQVPYGKFAGPFFKGGKGQTAAMVKLYEGGAPAPLPFRFGYPDVNKQSHLLVTRKKKHLTAP